MEWSRRVRRMVSAVAVSTAATATVGAVLAAPAVSASTGYAVMHRGDAIGYGQRHTALTAQSWAGQAIRFAVQSDGNAVLTVAGRTRYQTRTSGRHAILRFQRNGDLVLRTARRVVKDWHLAGSAAARVVLRRDGDLVVYASSGRILWQTGPKAARPVTAATMLNSPVPSYAQHKAGTLRNGTLPTQDPGFVTMSRTSGVFPVLGDYTGDGVRDGVAALGGSAGGVSWPEYVLFYTNGKKLLGYFDTDVLGHQEHEDITSLTTRGRQVTALVTSYEGAGFNFHHYRTTWRYAGGHMNRISTTQLD